jgi:hypothetical protein
MSGEKGGKIEREFKLVDCYRKGEAATLHTLGMSRNIE